MGKNFSTIKGDRKNRYFEEVLTAETSNEDKLERLCAEVSSAWVRNTCIPRGSVTRKQTEVAAKPAPVPQDEPVPTVVPQETKEVGSAPVATPAKAVRFNPYAIHTTNVFKKEGADGLRSALENVTDAAHLKSMITAQRIPISDVDAMTDAAALRASIVTAVEARISDRKAAAT